MKRQKGIKEKNRNIVATSLEGRETYFSMGRRKVVRTSLTARKDGMIITQKRTSRHYREKEKN